MRWAQLVAISVAVVILGGCAYIGTDAPSTSEVESLAPTVAASAAPSSVASETVPAVSIEPSPVALPSPSPTASPAVTPPDPTPLLTPCCESSPLPSPSHAAGLAASNRFWEHWYDTCWFGAFDIVSSLSDIASQSDLVLLGTITDLYVKRPWDDFQPVYAWVSITEILKGEPASEEPGMLEVQIGFIRSDLEELRSSLPAHGHLWFLSQYENGAATYHPTDYPQVGILRDIGGVVQVIMPEAIANAFSPRHYPVPLDGTSFAELVDRVREAAAGQSGANRLLARWMLPDEPDRSRFAAC